MFVSVMAILTESITKPKKVICCVGVIADFLGCVVKRSSVKDFPVFLMLLKQLRAISASSRKLSRYLTDK